jgi:hypothetical protein
MKHDFTRSRATADRMIREWGQPAELWHRDGSKRQCTAAIMNYSPQERLGQPLNPTDRKALVSALAPDGGDLAEPDYVNEQLVTFQMNDDRTMIDPQTVDERLSMPYRAARVGTSAVTVFWRVAVRK